MSLFDFFLNLPRFLSTYFALIPSFAYPFIVLLIGFVGVKATLSMR